jgi:hypothetical protein
MIVWLFSRQTICPEEGGVLFWTTLLANPLNMTMYGTIEFYSEVAMKFVRADSGINIF